MQACMHCSVLFSNEGVFSRHLDSCDGPSLINRMIINQGIFKGLIYEVDGVRWVCIPKM